MPCLPHPHRSFRATLWNYPQTLQRWGKIIGIITVCGRRRQLHVLGDEIGGTPQPVPVLSMPARVQWAHKRNPHGDWDKEGRRPHTHSGIRNLPAAQTVLPAVNWPHYREQRGLLLPEAASSRHMEKPLAHLCLLDGRPQHPWADRRPCPLRCTSGPHLPLASWYAGQEGGKPSVSVDYSTGTSCSSRNLGSTCFCKNVLKALWLMTTVQSRWLRRPTGWTGCG